MVLTGGEPLLRKNIEILIEQLAALRTPDGQPLDLTLTTNGSLLARKAQSLKDAGLQRVTVSLDGLDDTVFRQMNDVDFPVADVLAGIEAARAAGLGPIKVNMVVKRGTNEHEILPMARHFRGTGIVLRFIEYMDVGATNGWCMDEVLPSAEVIRCLQTDLPLVQLDPAAPGETAERWGYANAQGEYDPALGEVGVISSVTQAFCGDCNRARLSTEGRLYLCLFASQGYDLRQLLRDPAKTDAQLAGTVVEAGDGLQVRRLLVDCGFGIRQLATRLGAAGLGIDQIDVIFITHEHADHVGCAHTVAMRHRIPVFMSRGTHVAIGAPDFDGLLQMAHEFEQNALADNDVVAGQIDIGCFETVAPLYLPRLIAGFKARWPGVEIRMRDGEQIDTPVGEIMVDDQRRAPAPYILRAIRKRAPGAQTRRSGHDDIGGRQAA